MTSRRGFLGYFAALGAVALVPTLPKAAVPVESVLPPTTDSFETITIKREPGFFDVSTYKGDGVSSTIPCTIGFAPSFIMIKCSSKIGGDWHITELGGAAPTLPAKFNEDGESYIAYLFGEKAMPQIQPYINKLKSML
jgi:hypothetical protein